MKKALLILFIVILTSCGEDRSDEDRPDYEKKIIHYVEEGHAKYNRKIDSFKITKFADTNAYHAVYYYRSANIAKGAEMKITQIFHFNSTNDSIVKVDDISSHMKVRGEWANTGL